MSELYGFKKNLEKVQVRSKSESAAKSHIVPTLISNTPLAAPATRYDFADRTIPELANWNVVVLYCKCGNANQNLICFRGVNTQNYMIDALTSTVTRGGYYVDWANNRIRVRWVDGRQDLVQSFVQILAVYGLVQNVDVVDTDTEDEPSGDEGEDIDITGLTEEVQGIRIGADGTIYETAGEAVRAQYEKLAEMFDLQDLEEILQTINDTVDTAIQQIETAGGLILDPTLTQSGQAAPAKAVGDLQEASIFDLTDFADHSTRISAGITYTYNGNNEWSVSGTLSGTSFCPLFSSSSKTAPFVAGKNYKVWFTSTSSNIYLQLYKYVGSTLTLVGNIYSKVGFQSVSFPADATGILLRIRTSASVSNVTVTAYIYEDNAVFNKLSLIDTDLSTKIGYVKALTHNNDLDTTTDVGVYAYSNSDKPANAPPEESNAVIAVLHGFHSQGFLVQLGFTYTGKMLQRLQYTNGTWTAWSDLSSGETVIENTYNINTSPTITTDSHGWLQAVDTDTSDETGKTDMTGAIMSMLNDTGYCHLGEGIFYVSGNIDMPEESTLCGCGKKTVVRLLQSSTTGYCVKIGKYCTIKDISFEGARSFTVPSTKGTRNGIAFVAEYDGTPSVQTEHCMIDNIWCKFFSGAGIYCHNTSINYAKGVHVTNAFIDACYAGIDIDYYSEFNKFVNVCTSWCKYGCINNGGNNVFSSCTFHATDVGFYIDGTQPNHGHGTLTGCTFCHIGSNAGIAIKLEGVTNGFIIDACQVWYNSIDITGSNGIVISNCELGRGTTGAGATINITNGATILFTGCMFMNDVNYAPDITITNNSNVKFANCYGSVSGNAITA